MDGDDAECGVKAEKPNGHEWPRMRTAKACSRFPDTGRYAPHVTPHLTSTASQTSP